MFFKKVKALIVAMLFKEACTSSSETAVAKYRDMRKAVMLAEKKAQKTAKSS